MHWASKRAHRAGVVHLDGTPRDRWRGRCARSSPAPSRLRRTTRERCPRGCTGRAAGSRPEPTALARLLADDGRLTGAVLGKRHESEPRRRLPQNVQRAVPATSTSVTEPGQRSAYATHLHPSQFPSRVGSATQSLGLPGRPSRRPRSEPASSRAARDGTALRNSGVALARRRPRIDAAGQPCHSSSSQPARKTASEPQQEPQNAVTSTPRSLLLQTASHGTKVLRLGGSSVLPRAALLTGARALAVIAVAALRTPGAAVV